MPLAADIRRRLGAPPRLDGSPPQVSIVVVNRDGEQHLRRLLAGLAERTDYPRFELIVVDNASSDGSVDLLRTSAAPFPIAIAVNAHNETFSDACNQGAELARGELLLFLNNDTEPFESGWLAELVACLERTGAGLVGTTLLQPGEGEGSVHGLVVHHRGMRFLDEDGILRADLHGLGDSPFGDGFGEDRESPVVSAACLLVARDVFDRVGGFSRGYRYGVEDTDLGLKVRAAGGSVVVCGRAFVIHHPGSTRRTVPFEERRARQQRNRRLLMERWGPRLRREHDLDVVDGLGLWAAPGAAPGGTTRERVLAPGYCVKVATPDPTQLAVARSLLDVLAERDRRSLLLAGADVDQARAAGYDVAVHLQGDARYVLATDAVQHRVLWAPDPVAGDRVTVDPARYDLVVSRRDPRHLVDAIEERVREFGLPARIAPPASWEPSLS